MRVSLEVGDCLDVMRRLPAGSIDLVLCDPPYGTTRCAWDTALDLPALWAEYRRVVKENGAILLFAQTPFDKVLGASNLDELRYEIVWEKTNATGFLNAKRAPLKAHENILVFYRKAPFYFPEKTTGHARRVSRGRQGAAAGRESCYGAQDLNPRSYDSTERYPRSVMRIATELRGKSVHPTQKPVALLRKLIRMYSRPGEVVLDNCMGSGSTGVAAVLERRRFIGIEKSLDWAEIAAGRIEWEGYLRPKPLDN